MNKSGTNSKDKVGKGITHRYERKLIKLSINSFN